jgi:hypothetical protein
VKPVYSRGVKILSIISWARRPVYLLKGNEKRSGENLSALMLGKDITLAHYSELICSGEATREKMGKSFVWGMTAKALSIQPNPDMILVALDRFYAATLRRQDFLLIPQWILFTLDISKPFSELMQSIKTKSLSNNLRKIKKQNYTYEVSRDPDKFDLFYHQMYLPYATIRFRDSSWIFSYRSMKQQLESGQLLLVKQNNKYLSGNLVVDREKCLFSHSIGVMNGNYEYVAQGVQSAAYYFIIKWAKQQGYKRIDFGYTRPFLRDGIFLYKKRWGMEINNINRSMGLGVLGLKICHFTRSVRSFLTENPFIFIAQNKLKGLLLIEQSEPLTSKEAQKLMRIHHIKGLDGMIILSPQGFTQETREMAEEQYPHSLDLVDTDVEAFFEQLSDPQG